MDIENKLSINNEKIIYFTKELNKLFNLFNERYYNSELNTPMILIQTNSGVRRRAAGWCTTQKIWKDSENQERYYEITVCAEYLYQDIKDTCVTMLHEMVHLYCRQNDIKDTSRGGTYHNSKFKEMAEKHGLIITHDERIGWSPSQLNKEAEDFIDKNVSVETFTLTRLNNQDLKDEETDNNDENQEEKKKSSSRKYICPECGAIVRATKDVNILCVDCGIEFEKEES